MFRKRLWPVTGIESCEFRELSPPYRADPEDRLFLIKVGAEGVKKILRVCGVVKNEVFRRAPKAHGEKNVFLLVDFGELSFFLPGVKIRQGGLSSWHPADGVLLMDAVPGGSWARPPQRTSNIIQTFNWARMPAEVLLHKPMISTSITQDLH